MTRALSFLLLAGLAACSQGDPPAKPPPALSDFAKQVLLTYDELKVQPGAAAFMRDIDADAALTAGLAKGLNARGKKRLQALVDKYKDDETFRAAVVAAGGDPAACGQPSPDEKDAVPDCEKKPLNLLDP